MTWVSLFVLSISKSPLGKFSKTKAVKLAHQLTSSSLTRVRGERGSSSAGYFGLSHDWCRNWVGEKEALCQAAFTSILAYLLHSLGTSWSRSQGMLFSDDLWRGPGKGQGFELWVLVGDCVPFMWTAPVAGVVQLLSCMYCDPTDCSPPLAPLSTGISQVRTLDSLLWYKQWSVVGFSGDFRI